MTEAEEATPVEYTVFGLAFRQAGAITYFAENIQPEHIGALQSHTGLREFYVSLLAFHRETQLDPIDPIAYQCWLEQDAEVATALGGAPGVKVFVDHVCEVDLPSQESVAAILKYRANKRRQLDALQELHLLLTKRSHKSDNDVARITFLTDQIRALEHEVGYNPWDGVTTGEDIAERAKDLWELPDFLPTQYPSLNQALGYDVETGGFVRGAIHAIIAPSGHGKSTFAKCLMNHWLEQGKSVVFVNFEEAENHWERILMTQVTGQNIYDSGALTQQEKDDLTEVFKMKMAEWGKRFVRHEPNTCYFEDLETWLRDILGHNENLPEVVIIDTIQSMFTKGAGGKPRWAQYEEMMVRLEKLAKDMHCVMILTAQENTNRMKERREVVQQSDTGGSIAIEQKCSITIHLTQKRLANQDDTLAEEIMQLQIPKNRITGNRFTNDPPLIRYHDATKTYLPHDIVGGNDYVDYDYDPHG